MVQTVSGVISPIIAGIALIGKNNIPPGLWWALLFIAALCLAITLLNLYVGWWRTPHVIQKQGLITTFAPTSALELSSTVARDVVAQKIGFDYLPQSPLGRDWTIAYRDDDVNPTFAATQSPSGTGLKLSVYGKKFAMDYPIVSSAKLSRRVSFSVHPTATTMVFLGFQVTSADATTVETRWVKIELGNRPPEVTKEYPIEYTIWINGEHQDDGWVLLDIPIPVVFRQTWGTQAWNLQSVTRFRVRGDVSISPISFFG